MDEKKEEEKPKQEDETAKPKAPAEAKDEGDKYETTPVIERAREEREKLELATKAQREENDRTEQIMAKQALGGETEAGTETKEETQDDKDQAQADQLLKEDED